ncbi:MAG: single-stranded DNA-binding protein [Candidatus Omnitrophica bacterium]|nr:single-stranded DNA-binding protein [Candidatus Omnitrophota bacterium]
MANLNKVILIGNITRDPELRYIPSGTAVATFTVATNRAYTLASGEKREESCFVRVVTWGRQAELCGQYLSKGSPVCVEGRLQSRSWETPDGQKRSTIEVVAQNVQFLGKAAPKASEELTGALMKDEVPAAVAAEEPPAHDAPPAETATPGDVPF